jgi:hypothetical protein
MIRAFIPNPALALALALVLALVTAPGARADEDAFRAVIDAQIEAFQSDDLGAAFDYAAPNIKGIFRDPERFGRMVREGYPMVWRPGSVEYLSAEPGPRGWEQDVMVGHAGRLHVLRYTMVETEDGWRIAGVRVLREAAVGA